MPCEQLLKLGKTHPRGLALIVFSTRSALTLGLSLLGESLPRGINEPSSNQDNCHLNSQQPAGRSAVSLVPRPVPTSLNTNACWCDRGPRGARFSKAGGKELAETLA